MLERLFRGRRTIHTQLKNVEDKLTALERLLSQLQVEKGGHNVAIENVHVHHPVLENLTFRLDKIDVEEVSGALNLGNNFGMRVHQRPKVKRPARKAGAPSSEGEEPSPASEVAQPGASLERPKMVQTSRGYTFQLHTDRDD